MIDTESNRNYANFGCATQNNLAQMIANPADLLGPRACRKSIPPSAPQVIEDWREPQRLISKIS